MALGGATSILKQVSLDAGLGRRTEHKLEARLLLTGSQSRTDAGARRDVYAPISRSLIIALRVAAGRVERLRQATPEQVSIYFAIPIDTVKMAMHVIQHGLGTEVLVGRITLSEAYERVRAKEQAAAAQTTDTT